MKGIFLVVGIVAFISLAAADPSSLCREAAEMKKNPFECCDIPKMIPSEAKDLCKSRYGRNSAKNAAMKDAKSGEQPGEIKIHKRMMCMPECLLNETSILNAGKIDSAKAISVFSSAVSGDKEFGNVISAAVRYCVADMPKHEEKFAEIMKNMKTIEPISMEVCNPLAGFFISCVHLQILFNCPAEKTTTNAECTSMKDYAKKNECLFPMRRYKNAKKLQ